MRLPLQIITAAYWGFTVTDGALRMLVVLYFHQLGYSALQVASLFLFYEFFGIVTNLFGGWLAHRFGLNKTLFSGLILQVIALYLLSQENWLSIAFVMFVQAISGIAKDLNKMSAKSSVKLIINNDQQAKLYRWVSFLTGSKNALKGAGFFLGGFLLELVGYQQSLLYLALGLSIIGLASFILLPKGLSVKQYKAKFKQLLAKSKNINRLSAARLFLFAARDVWFVVALPVYLQASLHWSYSQIGTLMAGWIILYGIVQSATPKLLNKTPGASLATNACLALLALLIIMLLAIQFDLSMRWIILFGLLGFAVIFAVNSAIHSFLILHYSDKESVSLDVGFYYMSNAAGRLLGTVLSGLFFQLYGFASCIAISALMILICFFITRRL